MRQARSSVLVIATAAAVLSTHPLRAQKPDVRASLVAPAALAAGSKATLTVEMTLGAKWHVNSHTPLEDFLVATSVTLTTSAGTLTPIRYPKHVEKRLSFSEKPLAVYEGTVRFEADLELPAGAKGKTAIFGNVSYQACNDQQCFPPAKLPLEASVVVSSPR